MYNIILAVHILTTIALIVIVLVQRTSSEGMGLTGSSSSSNLLSGRAAANFATRATSLLGLIFVLTSLSLGFIVSRNHVNSGTIADKIASRPAGAPNAAAPSTESKKPLPAAVPTPDAKGGTSTVPVPSQQAPAVTPEASNPVQTAPVDAAPVETSPAEPAPAQPIRPE